LLGPLERVERLTIMIDRYLREGKVYLTDKERLELMISKNHLAFDANEKLIDQNL